jgi:hypothetical protein
MRPQKTLRFTFRVINGEVQLQSVEKVDMICPPTVGQTPEAGRDGGFWMELQDEATTPLFHRTLNEPMANSVEVHSPDGKIERIFGPPRDGIFEVLVPDDPRAADLVLMGQPVSTADRALAADADAGTTRELARFAIPKGDTP